MIRRVAIFVAFAVVGIDQVLKRLANGHALPRAVGPIQLLLVHNPGAMLGILRGDRWLLSIAGIVAILVMGYLWKASRQGSWWFWIGWASLLGGIIGNEWDRIVYGYVTDMLHIHPLAPVFNVADVAIRSGIVMMFIGLWRERTVRKNVA